MMTDEILFFPHENLRPVQNQLVNEILQALKEKKNILVHAPTGLGKTAASLSPALQIANEKDLTIFFLTSRHTQHKIVLETVKKINQKINQQINCTSIIGKKWMCAINGSSLMKTNDFNEFCKNMRVAHKCNFYENSKSKTHVEGKLLIEELSKKMPIPVEELITESITKEVCPYETAITMASNSKIIVADYYYIFNSSIRESFLKKTNKTIEKSIIIIDEGHNLPDRIRNLLSQKISTKTITYAIKEAKKYNLETLKLPLIQLMEILHKLIQEPVPEKIVNKEEFENLLKNIKDIEELMAELNAGAELVREEKRKSLLGSIANFLENWTQKKEGFARIIKKTFDNITLELNCLDPSVAVKEVVEQCYSTIIMSGTLTPTLMYQDILGFTKDTVKKEFPNPFPEKNKLALIIPKTTTKFTLRNDQQYNNISKICCEITNNIKGNSLIFFPSYNLRDSVGKYFYEQTNKTILLEQPKMNKEEKQQMLDKFSSYKNTGAVLLAATSGSFGEGIDLPGVIKSVIVVGLPLDKPDLQTKELINYFEQKFKKGWDYGYILPAVTKILQNAGRCLRSEKDRGVLIFLDERYAWPMYKKCFPNDWNIKISSDYAELIKKFFIEEK